MAWIRCNCVCGCIKSKEVGPPRSASVRRGLCDRCKDARHGGMRFHVDTFVKTEERTIIFSGLEKITHR